MEKIRAKSRGKIIENLLYLGCRKKTSSQIINSGCCETLMNNKYCIRGDGGKSRLHIRFTLPDSTERWS